MDDCSFPMDQPSEIRLSNPPVHATLAPLTDTASDHYKDNTNVPLLLYSGTVDAPMEAVAAKVDVEDDSTAPPSPTAAGANVDRQPRLVDLEVDSNAPQTETAADANVDRPLRLHCSGLTVAWIPVSHAILLHPNMLLALFRTRVGELCLQQWQQPQWHGTLWDDLEDLKNCGFIDMDTAVLQLKVDERTSLTCVNGKMVRWNAMSAWWKQTCVWWHHVKWSVTYAALPDLDKCVHLLHQPIWLHVDRGLQFVKPTRSTDNIPSYRSIGMVPEPDRSFRQHVARRFQLRSLSDFFGSCNVWPCSNVFVEAFVDYGLLGTPVYTQSVMLKRLYRELTQVVECVCPLRVRPEVTTTPTTLHYGHHAASSQHICFDSSTYFPKSIQTVLFTRALYNDVSQAIFNPARQLLWLPFQENERRRFQNFVSGPVRSLSRIVGAVLSMVLTTSFIVELCFDDCHVDPVNPGRHGSSTILCVRILRFVTARTSRFDVIILDFTPDQIQLVKETSVNGETNQAHFVLNSLSHKHIASYAQELRAFFHKKDENGVSLTPLHTNLRLLNLHTAAKRAFALHAEESYFLPEAKTFPAGIFNTMDLMMLVNDK
ncbi:hypothetical protein PsorP6_004835 [Peronosclerospora sorghi]|uniref:Uncharacterized protein n=1 Tax=Peronosclerospora sorghi TaxID=230839 RepID=A0ACC0VNN4_9STRA|nr:hypothetical protein PsorP6_004835 [Peronosclerospora sorghi]